MRVTARATLSQAWRQSSLSRYALLQRRYYKPETQRKLPTVELCPEPSCQCKPTPEGLDIDRSGPMTKPSYDEHVIVSTGKSDWSSNIQIDPETGAAVNALKFFLSVSGRPHGVRRMGEFYNPNHNVMISNSSLQSNWARTSSPPQPSNWERRPPKLSVNVDVTSGEFKRETEIQRDNALSLPRLGYSVNGIGTRIFLPPNAEAPKGATSIYLFPSCKYVTIPTTPDPQTFYAYIRRFVKNFVVPKKVDPEIAEMAALAGLPIVEDLERGQDYHLDQINVMDVVILICGHHKRDTRCGIMGPLLQQEFEEKLPNFGVKVVEGRDGRIKNEPSSGVRNPQTITQKHVETPTTARVGLISHIGGHKWAGNVIIYFPKYYKKHPLAKHPLCGKGIWYGRVEPWHVEGIIEQTIKQGNIIRELFRGGMPSVELDDK